MAAVDLDRLCSRIRLCRIQADQLYCLDDDSTVPIPKIKGMSVADAIATIRTSISEIPDVKERIKCVCAIYTRLMANRAFGPWVLYHVAAAECKARGALLDRFLQDMHLKHVPTDSLAITEGTYSRLRVGSGKRQPQYGPRSLLLHLLDFVSVRCSLQFRVLYGWSTPSPRSQRYPRR
ncbi:hypothetical protein MTO96_026550 [Rhipicephalus appendiculatus]